VEGVLTPQERLILHLIAEGYSNREIAGSLGLSVKTIETDRAAVKRKLKVKSLAALVRYAVRNGLVES
jgi:DNA-binding NarL/FixJ family response regulator